MPGRADRRRASRREVDTRIIDRDATARLAGALAGRRPQHRRAAGAAPDHRHHRREQSAGLRRHARAIGAGTADRVRSTITAPGSTGWWRWRARTVTIGIAGAGADVVRDGADRGVRDARRDGRQRPHHRGAAFRRRRGGFIAREFRRHFPVTGRKGASAGGCGGRASSSDSRGGRRGTSRRRRPTRRPPCSAISRSVPRLSRRRPDGAGDRCVGILQTLLVLQRGQPSE